MFESKLRRIATRGAVVLFNAVRKQQKAAAEEAAPKAGKAVTAAGGTIDKKSFLTKLTEKSKSAVASSKVSFLRRT